MPSDRSVRIPSGEQWKRQAVAEAIVQSLEASEAVVVAVSVDSLTDALAAKGLYLAEASELRFPSLWEEREDER